MFVENMFEKMVGQLVTNEPEDDTVLKTNGQVNQIAPPKILTQTTV